MADKIRVTRSRHRRYFTAPENRQAAVGQMVIHCRVERAIRRWGIVGTVIIAMCILCVITGSIIPMKGTI